MHILRGNCGQNKPIVDVGLAPVLPRPEVVTPQLLVPEFPVTPLRALLDTGADGTSISHSVARSHRLENLGLRPVVGVGGVQLHPTWAAFLCFFYQVSADFEGDGHVATGAFVVDEPLLAVEIPHNRWFDVIVGRDVLTKFDFFIRRGGDWELHLG